MTDKTEKATVYTPEVVEELKAVYLAEKSDEGRKNVVVEFADRLGVSISSVRGKLVAEKVYIKPEAKTKTGEPIETKEFIVGTIEARMGLEPGDPTRCHRRVSG